MNLSIILIGLSFLEPPKPISFSSKHPVCCHLISVAGHDDDHVLHDAEQHDDQVGRDEGEVGHVVHSGTDR